MNENTMNESTMNESTMNESTKLLRIHPNDSVAVALADLKKGETVAIDDKEIVLESDVPFGHKVAVCFISKGTDIIKYGASIGHATEDIPEGSWVHTHNMKTNLSGHVSYSYTPVSYPLPSPSGTTFDGYLWPDGTAGTRNEIWIIPTVGCVNTTALTIAEKARVRFNGRTDGIFAFCHNMGCSQMSEDQERTQRLLAGLVHNPNAGGVLVLSLGCENNNLDVFTPFLGKTDPSRVRFLITQDEEDEVESALKILDELVSHVEKRKRQPLPLSKLCLGFKCGGSDAFSGITANALCGRVNDILCASGATTLLTEVPEMFGAETLLMNRAINADVFSDVVNLINTFKDYYTRYNQTIYENPSPGNKKGGISSLEEKSLGCIQKGGQAPVVGVLDYGQAPEENGLHLLIGPGNDQVSCTNLTASGANMLIFTTGRGNPFGAPVPTVKLASNDRMATRKHGWIDFSAGSVLHGQSFDEMTKEFLDYLIDVASGRVQTRNEIGGYREISIFRDGVIL